MQWETALASKVAIMEEQKQVIEKEPEKQQAVQKCKPQLKDKEQKQREQEWKSKIKLQEESHPQSSCQRALICCNLVSLQWYS